MTSDRPGPSSRLRAALVGLALLLVGLVVGGTPAIAASAPRPTTVTYTYDSASHVAQSRGGVPAAAAAVSPRARSGWATLTSQSSGRPDGSAVAAETATSADTIVLGHFPEYVDVAKATGGRTFQVPTKVWDSMSSEQQWAANQKFLDRAIARGSNVQLATAADAAREGSFFEKELQYMQSQGYTVAPDGMSVRPPGLG